ncbi:MAG: hypothetical protein QOH85_2005 [Acidobacteriaceae bacterium]|nr:hypothetical protein [Acidobacteriaceae bacterium]
MAFVAVAVSLTLLGCGKNFYFAGRTLPPSGVLQRVLVAVDNPSGSLQFMDAFYDIRHPFNNPNGQFSISGFSGSNPVTIQNLPEEQTGLVYNSGNGSLASINYAQEKQNSDVLPAGAIATSVFGSHKLDYFVTANQNAHAMLVFDVALGQQYLMNVPGIYRISMNSNATLVLGFVQDSNLVYSLFKLTPAQQTQYSTPAAWNGVFQDCEPQTLPKYCVTQVADPKGAFDRPVKAIFSADGQSIYVLNCGQECGGGTNAGLVTIPISNAVLNNNVAGPAGIALQAGAFLPVPGGATNALQSGTTLYVAGQHLIGNLLAGSLSSVDLGSYSVTGQYSISDGKHNKMSFADDNTLWIGSQGCQSGYRFSQNQAGATDSNGNVIQFGCLTQFNTATKVATVDRYIGDLTGIADVEGLHKIYVGEGGQVHIYRTTDFTELDNTNVTVTGTVSDVAYMDGSSDANNTTY